MINEEPLLVRYFKGDLEARKIVDGIIDQAGKDWKPSSDDYNVRPSMSLEAELDRFNQEPSDGEDAYDYMVSIESDEQEARLIKYMKAMNKGSSYTDEAKKVFLSVFNDLITAYRYKLSTLTILPNE
jgi:hypothetical protein